MGSWGTKKNKVKITTRKDAVPIINLGSEECQVVADDIRGMDVYTQIYPHTVSVLELKTLPNIKGFVLYGGANNIVDGVSIDAPDAVYDMGLPVLRVDHGQAPPFPPEDHIRQGILDSFIFEACKAKKMGTIIK